MIYFRDTLRAKNSFLILKLNTQKFFFVVLASMLTQNCFSQIQYRSRYKSALLAEGFGIGPVMSVNYEIAPIRYKSGFLAARVGLGFLPAAKGNGAGFSIPVGVTYNFLINNLRKGIASRVMNKCRSSPPKFALEYFLETGLGYAKIVYPASANRDYVTLYTAIKTQLVIDIPPKPRVIQIKMSINPRLDIPDREILFFEGNTFLGGFALGISI
ncbi:MAG: hypothetical protein ACI9DJ_002277 [Algoriphagus sp.]|jgi:hypothetical protein